MAHLLLPAVPRPKRHPAFVELLSRRWLRSARLLLQDAFARLPAREHDFVQRFQSEEFDRRTFELFVSELLYESGAHFTANGPHPDFEPTIAGVSFAIECATANATSAGGPPRPYRAIDPKVGDMAKLRERLMNDVPTRFSGILAAKQAKRFKPNDLAYWELPHVAGKPFLYAVQTFHEDGALSYSGTAVATYLYGILHTPVFDADGKLIVKQSKVDSHLNRNGQLIPSGFFDDPDNRFVSGVLWANSGTIPKFARMAIEGPYRDDDVAVFRAGTEMDPDPNAHAPLPFVYHVGTGGHLESWGEGVVLFHNPNAAHPLPLDLMKNVCNAYIDADGRYVETTSIHSAHPYMSMTFGGHGAREIQAAERSAALYYETVAATVERIERTRSPDWWNGFKTGPEVRSYRSDSLET
jgi:hypothetical protein